MLESSKRENCTRYNEILPFYETQLNGAFCGIASAAIVLNTIAGKKVYSQNAIYQNFVLEKIIADDDEMRYGKQSLNLC